MQTTRWCWLTLTLLGFGCGAVDKTAQEKPAMRALGQKAVVVTEVDDETIGHEIRRRLALADPDAAATVVIEVIDAQVTLRGTAVTRANAWKAEAAAYATPGVAQVVNEIVIQEKTTGFGE
jgi:osmotically-inducible protein OsmY